MRITINGVIVADEDKWLYDYFKIPATAPQTVRNALAELADGEELTLEVNSGGGSVFAGFEIYSLLRGAKARVVAEVQSLAASAASTIVMAADAVRMWPVAQIMMHLPTCETRGDEIEHDKSLRLLSGIKESILNAYTIKSAGKATRDELSKMMDAETWLPAQDAVEKGLADEIIDGAKLQTASVADVTNGVGAPSFGALMAKYRAAVAGGAKPADGHPVEFPKQTADNWSDKARVRLEKEKYLF